MTKQEAAIVSAYTGILCGDFNNMHSYIEKLFDRSAFTHEMGDKKFTEQIKERSKMDFINLDTNT